MIIDIERLPAEGIKINKDFEFNSTELVEEDTVFLDPVHADVLVKKAGEEIFISGRIFTRLSFICCRCLSPFEFRVNSRFDLVYLPEELDDYKEKLDGEDMTKLFYHSQKIDLREVLLEQLNFTFPTRPLCSENCQGICPVCGKVINEGQCSCAANESDPRLEKFKFFFRDKR
jgi:uncharacterized protein